MNELWVVKVQIGKKIEVKYGSNDRAEAQKAYVRIREDLARRQPGAIVYPPELDSRRDA